MFDDCAYMYILFYICVETGFWILKNFVLGSYDFCAEWQGDRLMFVSSPDVVLYS